MALSRRLGSLAKPALNVQEASFLPLLPQGLTSPQNTFLEKEQGSQEPGPGAGLAPPGASQQQAQLHIGLLITFLGLVINDLGP